MNDPDLTAAQLGELMELTERQVKDRVAKGIFVCHWRGGTEKHPRSMRFTPEDVEHNRSTGATKVRPALMNSPAFVAKARKGGAKLRRAKEAATS